VLFRSLGFESSHLLTATVRLPGTAEDTAPAAHFLPDFLARVERLPGVTSVGAISAAPLTGNPHNAFVIEGRPAPRAGTIQDAVLTIATPGYFRTMGIALRRGRYFTPSDTATAPKVALVSEGLTRRYFPTEEPLGHRVSFDQKDYFTIAGVVGDVHEQGAAITPKPQIYLTHAQLPVLRMVLEVHSSTEPSALISAIRGELRAMNPDLPIYDIKTVDALVDESVAPRRLALTLIGVFSGLALLVASIGIYGVISYSVTERTQEFGVRMSLGAMRSDVLQMVLWRGLRMAGVGIALGTLGAGRDARARRLPVRRQPARSGDVCRGCGDLRGGRDCRVRDSGVAGDARGSDGRVKRGVRSFYTKSHAPWPLMSLRPDPAWGFLRVQAFADLRRHFL